MLAEQVWEDALDVALARVNPVQDGTERLDVCRLAAFQQRRPPNDGARVLGGLGTASQSRQDGSLGDRPVSQLDVPFHLEGIVPETLLAVRRVVQEILGGLQIGLALQARQGGHVDE